MLELDCFLHYRISHATRNFISYRYWASVVAARCGFKMVLFTASRGNTFVGDKRALIKSFMGIQSNGPYSNTVIGTLAVNGWAVNGTARGELGRTAARPGPSALYQM